MNPQKFPTEPDHYQTQTEAIIEAIEKNPGITRSELGQLRTRSGFRIANITARISNARRKLLPFGKTIECKEDKTIKAKGFRIRCTKYIITDIAPCSSV